MTKQLTKRPIAYIILGSHTRETLEREVNLFIHKNSGEWWEPMGGLAVHGVSDQVLCFCQAMIQYQWVEEPEK